ncbi:unnamed protein product [Gongylonema pulchrum]|uniref:FAS1 domain-containing protein n=1 Tax=Gongylonema pulchrum TaxID=637853 RepID=A0A3P7MIH7_9BILA|nr:unnamed protein product [Gongylonema pulchrum]
MFRRASRCVSGDDNDTLIRIVECCDGYQTDDIKQGCSPLLTDELRDRLASNELISTVFVFNDTTFSSLSASLQARMRQRKGCAKDLIKEHIYDGMLCSAILQDDVKSITGTIHRFQKQHDGNGREILRLDNGRVVDVDQVASNGVIHLIDDNLTDEKSFVLNHIVMGDSHVTKKLVKTAYGSKVAKITYFRLCLYY